MIVGGSAMFLYVAIVVAILLSLIIQRKENRFVLFLVIVLISLVSGLRAYTVGTDSKYYHSIFTNFYSGGGIYFREQVFMYVAKALMQLTGSDRIVFLFYSFLTNTLIILRFWKWRDKGSFAMMMFYYLTLFFPQSMNIMRQYVAIAIIMWAFDYIFERKYKRFIIVIIIAALFHTSALIALVLIPLHYYMTNKITINKFAISILLLVGVALAIEPVKNIISNYSVYFSDKQLSIGMLFVARIVVFLSYLFIRGQRQTRVLTEDMGLFNDYITIMYAIGLGITFFGSYFDQMARIGLLFVFCSTPFMTITIKNNRYRQIYTLVYIMIAIMYFVFQVILKGEQGVIPYTFYFMGV